MQLKLESVCFNMNARSSLCMSEEFTGQPSCKSLPTWIKQERIYWYSSMQLDTQYNYIRHLVEEPNLTSSLLSFFTILIHYILKHPNYFHLRHVPIDKSALRFFHRHLFTILVITSEPFDVFTNVTTHLKAKDPLYKDHVTFSNRATLVKWYILPGQ